MMLLFPVIALGALLSLLYSGTWGGGGGRRDARAALLESGTALAVFVVVANEFLSLFRALNAPAIMIAWGVTSTLLCVVCLRTGAFGSALKLLVSNAGICQNDADSRQKATAGFLKKALKNPAVTGIIFIAAIEALIGLLGAPNTWDSMTYHLGRIVHWIQQESIYHFPTNITRQIYMPPWAEWAMLHLQLLSGTDRFAWLVQWLSMVGSAAAVSLVAREFGLSRRAQLLASLVSCTIPMGILQASSTQNDYAAGFWIAASLYFLIRFAQAPGFRSALFAGATLGLALLTKGTSYIFLSAIVGWWIFVLVRTNGAKVFRFAAGVLTILLVVTALNCPHWWRNYQLFEKPLGPPPESAGYLSVKNDYLTLKIAYANVLRNVGLHIITPFRATNRLIGRGIHHLLGKEIHNPASTWPGSTFKIRTAIHEDVSGNPTHLLLIILSVCGLAWVQKKHALLRSFIMAPGVAFIFFCLFLRWQPFHSRLHLPLFILSAPIIAGAAHIFAKRKMYLSLVAVLLFSSLPWLFFSHNRPIIGKNSILMTNRNTQYFIDRPLLQVHYEKAAIVLAAASQANIGVVMGDDEWEYPLWVLLKQQNSPKMRSVPRIEHVMIRNVSGRLLPAAFIPDLVVAVVPLDELMISGIPYTVIWSSGPVSIFARTILLDTFAA